MLISEPSGVPYSPSQFLAALDFFCRFLQQDCQNIAKIRNTTIRAKIHCFLKSDTVCIIFPGHFNLLGCSKVSKLVNSYEIQHLFPITFLKRITIFYRAKFRLSTRPFKFLKPLIKAKNESA